MNDWIVGLWDGHDAGAAVLCGDRVVAAVNEERLSRRKLDVGFPVRALQQCLDQAGLRPGDVSSVAVSTTDFSKTLTRALPHLKDEYYLIRRRKKQPGRFTGLKKKAKYWLTEIGPSAVTQSISRRLLVRELAAPGIDTASLHLVDHHEAHAASAAFYSGMLPCLVITLDGIGDGLSGSVWMVRPDSFELVSRISGRHSLGILFEHVTNLLHMRELEDEGKVMALADYACPVPDTHNPLMKLVAVEGMQIRCCHGSLQMHAALRNILWHYPPEQFARMAQRLLEVRVSELVSACVRQTGIRDIALAGGLFSNIKVNMHLRSLSGVNRVSVFPHMGDGGLALGAAAALRYRTVGVRACSNADVSAWGPSFSDEDIRDAIQARGLMSRVLDDVASDIAALIADGHIVFWYQGAMEYGPRALGHRSILARPDRIEIRDTLNLRLKLRVWYQPFCPSILEEDARACLEDCDGLENRFMTMAYRVRPEYRAQLQGVSGQDGTCRPHIVVPGDGRYAELLAQVKKRIGIGAVLNTSYNIHGDPLVCSPQDAIETFLKTRSQYLVMNDCLVWTQQEPGGEDRKL